MPNFFKDKFKIQYSKSVLSGHWGTRSCLASSVRLTMHFFMQLSHWVNDQGASNTMIKLQNIIKVGIMTTVNGC